MRMMRGQKNYLIIEDTDGHARRWMSQVRSSIQKARHFTALILTSEIMCEHSIVLYFLITRMFASCSRCRGSTAIYTIFDTVASFHNSLTKEPGITPTLRNHRSHKYMMRHDAMMISFGCVHQDRVHICCRHRPPENFQTRKYF